MRRFECKRFPLPVVQPLHDESSLLPTDAMEVDPATVCGPTAPGVHRQAGCAHLQLQKTWPAANRPDLGETPARLPGHGIPDSNDGCAYFRKYYVPIITNLNVFDSVSGNRTGVRRD